jgi:DNA helicase HerA-like ATPase
LVSFLDEKGRPNPVERVYVMPPESRIGPISAEERQAVIDASPVKGIYDQAVDRESAYERLTSRVAATPETTGGSGASASSAEGSNWGGAIKDSLGGLLQGSGRKDSLIEAMAKSAVRTIGSSVGREIVRGVLGSIMGRGKR